ncbi:MAG: hypothetical protein FRX49_06734 [Trebouxia sp. A1-2]|nr:MAG: hypothetical protein FRX49_06734 [Trebouxia sp. A1-2]
MLTSPRRKAFSRLLLQEVQYDDLSNHPAGVPGQHQTTSETHIAELGEASARQPVDHLTEDCSEKAGKSSNASKIIDDAPFTINDLQSELSSTLSVPHPANDDEWGAEFTASGASAEAALVLDQRSKAKPVSQHIPEPETSISSQAHDLDSAGTATMHRGRATNAELASSQAASGAVNAASSSHDAAFQLRQQASDGHLASDRAGSQAGIELDSSSKASLLSQQQTGTDEHPSSAVPACTTVQQQSSQSLSADAGTSSQVQHDEADAFSEPNADTPQPDDWTDNAFPEDPATAEQAVPSDMEATDADGAVCSSHEASADNWADQSFSSDAAQSRELLSGSIKTEASSIAAPPDAVLPAEQALVNHDWPDAAFPVDMQAVASQTPDASDANTSHRQTDSAAGDDSRPDPAVTSARPQAAEDNALADQSSSGDASSAAGSNDTSAVVSVQQPKVGVDDWADQASPERVATAAPVGAPAEQDAAEQAAADGDWGDDDFGDFNNAAEQGDDDDFGAFNEAGAEADPSDAPAAQSPESQLQHQQKPASPAVVADTPPPSTLSCLLNTDERELPGIIKCLLEPLAFPFHLPNPLSPLPIKSDGSPQWLYNGNALMEYHIKQAGRLPKDQVLATAGLLGQPTTDGMCPAAPSLNRSRVVTAGWQGSRGDTRLLARLGLSQAGLQDENDALEKALAAKNRWRRKSSSKGGGKVEGQQPMFASESPTRATEAQGALFGAHCLKPVPSEPPKGPLSYLSTVTTASSSEWGSRSLDSLTQQPSDVASMRFLGPLPPPAGNVTKTHDAVSTASDSTSASASMRRQGSSGAKRSSKDATNGVSHTQSPPQTQARPFITDKDKLRAGPQQPPSESRATAIQSIAASAGADWSAFGNRASSAFAGTSSQPTHTSERFALDSSNPFLDAPASQPAQAPGQLEMHVSNPFLEPGSMAHVEIPSAQLADHASNPFLDPPGHEASDALPTRSSNPSLAPVDVAPQHQLEMHGSNPFLLPSDDAWPEDPRSRQEQAAETLGVARVASGESFGDFNAPGEDDFEGTEWGGASAPPADTADWTTAAAMSTPDPFAASASFTDFAALLESGQSALPGSADAVMSTDLESMQQAVAGHVDLSELQHGLASNIEPADAGQQAASFAQGYSQTSGELFGSSTQQPHRAEIVVAGISIPDLSFMLTTDKLSISSRT